MNTGYCGALNPELKVGDIVAPARVLALESGEAFDCAPFRGPDPQSRGVLISMDRVAVTAAEKAALHARGADVVEMEAAGAATAARELAIPFVTIRAVSDGAGQDLPLDFNQFRDAGGRFRRPRIALASLGSPASVLPGLLRLDRNSRLASRSLGDFLADCRF
jgi:adenosylhomocysteine nucleosidase